MAKARKTDEVEAMLKQANEMLAYHGHRQEFKAGVCTMIEKLLRDKDAQTIQLIARQHGLHRQEIEEILKKNKPPEVAASSSSGQPPPPPPPGGAGAVAIQTSSHPPIGLAPQNFDITTPRGRGRSRSPKGDDSSTTLMLQQQQELYRRQPHREAVHVQGP